MMDVAGMDYAYEDMFKEISRKLYGTVGTVGAVGAVGTVVDTMQQANAANGQSVIAGVFNGVINEAIVVNGKMADFADAFKQQQQLSPEQQPSPPHQEAGGVIVEAAAAAAAYLHEQFQAETEAAAAALVGAAGVTDGDAMAVEYAEQAVAQPLEEDEASAGPGQAQAGEGEVDPNAPDTWFMTDESLEWTDSKIASYNPKQKLFRCIDCECCGFLARVAEHWLGTHANLRVFQCPHCPYASAWARCVRMHLARQHNASEQNALWTENPVLGEVTKYLSRLRERVEAGPLVVVSEEDLVDEEQQQLELEQHEQQLHEQQLREQQLHEQQLHEQQLREQQLHEQQLQQQLQQQQLQQQALAATASASGSPTHEYVLTGVSADSVVISGNVLSVQTASPATLTTSIATTSLAAPPAPMGPARVRNRSGKGPRRVNKAIAVAAAVAAATARGDAPDAAAAAGAAAKRYNCTSCPYQTDRRDLYTRHEAIHLAEKPFHCYACQKQFNRADHVKKHFLRMHRDQPYDLNRIRRTSKPTSPAVTATAGNGGTMAFYTASAAALADPDDVNGAVAVTDDQELQLQQLELEQQQLEQQQLQQHELQLQQQELQLQQQQQQQQIILQTQPVHLQQQQAPAAAINIPNMANYATALSSRLLAANNGHKDGQGAAQQLQMAPMQASVITESKVAGGGGGGVVVVPEGVVSVQVEASGGGGGGGGSGGGSVAGEDVPRTKGGREKRYPCPYCTWSGVDNWCLKRHLNTHLKPYVCALCDYKAARAERLQTHVLKVHNKRSCVRCSYMADDQNQLNAHLQEHHGQLDLVPQPPRAKRGPRKTGVGGAGPWGHPLPGTLPGPMYQPAGPGPHEVMNHIRRPPKRWRPRPQGADRLFNYLEASDSEDELELLPEDLVCQQCGLEFLDSESLQTHLMSMHRMTLVPSQGPASRPYHCTICGYSSHSHPDIVAHMQKHAVVEMRCVEAGCRYTSSVPGAMEEHVRLAHPPMPPLNQKCPHCGFVVLSATALSRHSKTHHLATVECSTCTRVLSRFDRHRTGDMWSEEEQEDDEELMAAAAQAAEDAVNAIDDDGDDGDPEADALGPSPKTLSDHELALRALRRQWRTRRRRLRRYHAMRKALRRLLSADADGQPVPPSFPGMPEAVVRLRVKHVDRWLSRRRLSCFACPPARRHAVAVHTVQSLALHRAWRHRPGGTPFPCDSCDARFGHRYQALLHASKDHADVADHDAEAEAEAARQRAIAEPIVTLTVPQYMASSATTTTTAGHHPLQVELPPGTHLQLQPAHGAHDQPAFSQLEALQVQPQVYQVQATADGTAEGYAMDGASITVVPVLYTCAPQQGPAAPQDGPQAEADAQEQQLQQEQFQQGTVYNGVMVPAASAVPDVPAVPVTAVGKQVWYPQLSTPSYYISTQFPST